MNSHHSPILHERMNTRKGRETLNNYQMLLDSGFSSRIVMRRLIDKMNPKKEYVMKCLMQAGNITNNQKVRI